jgi:hypothetical protein
MTDSNVTQISTKNMESMIDESDNLGKTNTFSNIITTPLSGNKSDVFGLIDSDYQKKNSPQKVVYVEN